MPKEDRGVSAYVNGLTTMGEWGDLVAFVVEWVAYSYAVRNS